MDGLTYSLHQPNFIPWLGYFNKIARSDIFIYLDNVQYVKNTIANRNKLRDKNSDILITVPITRKVNGRSFFPYREAVIADKIWYRKLFKLLQYNYKTTTYYKKYISVLESIFTLDDFCHMNIQFIEFVLKEFDISTKTYIMSVLGDDFGKKTDMLINLGKVINGNVYLSGQGARKYNDEGLFRQNNIRLIYQEYKHPVYKQVYEPFIPFLSVLDLLLNCGPDGRKYII